MISEDEIEFNVERVAKGQKDFDRIDEVKRKRQIAVKIIPERKQHGFRSQRTQRMVSEDHDITVPGLEITTSIQSFRNTKGTAMTGRGLVPEDENEIFMQTAQQFDLPSPIRFKRPTLPTSISATNVKVDQSLIGIVDGNSQAKLGTTAYKKREESLATDRLRDKIMKEQLWFWNKKYQNSGKVPKLDDASKGVVQLSNTSLVPGPRVKGLAWRAAPPQPASYTSVAASSLVATGISTPAQQHSEIETRNPLKPTGYKADVRMTERGLLQPAEDHYSSARKQLAEVRSEFDRVKKIHADDALPQTRTNGYRYD